MDEEKHATGVPVRIHNEGSRLRAHEQSVQEPVSDETLAAAVARGESAALEALYDRYAARVLGVVIKVIG